MQLQASLAMEDEVFHIFHISIFKFAFRLLNEFFVVNYYIVEFC